MYSSYYVFIYRYVYLLNLSMQLIYILLFAWYVCICYYVFKLLQCINTCLWLMHIFRRPQQIVIWLILTRWIYVLSDRNISRIYFLRSVLLLFNFLQDKSQSSFLSFQMYASSVFIYSYCLYINVYSIDLLRLLHVIN